MNESDMGPLRIRGKSGSIPTLPMTKSLKVVVLISKFGLSSSQESDQRRCLDLFNSKGILFEELDCSLAESRDKREFLFGMSKVRSFPQIFLENDGNIYKYVGTWEYVQELLDNRDIPADILAQHPEIQTFDSVFADVPRQITSQDSSKIF